MAAEEGAAAGRRRDDAAGPPAEAAPVPDGNQPRHTLVSPLGLFVIVPSRFGGFAAARRFFLIRASSERAGSGNARPIPSTAASLAFNEGELGRAAILFFYFGAEAFA